MPDQASCDQCNGPIATDTGFLFYSTARIGPPGAAQETGNMMLCPSCVDQIINTETWARPVSAAPELAAADALANPSALHKNVVQANSESIVTLCRRHGFSPEAAKAKAHELAVLSWKHPERGQAEALTFWRSPAKRVIALNCECGKHLRFGNNYVGTIVKCLQCSRQFMVPVEGDSKLPGGKVGYSGETQHGTWILECAQCGDFSDYMIRGEYGVSFTAPFLARCPHCGASPFPGGLRLGAATGISIGVLGVILLVLWWLGVFSG